MPEKLYVLCGRMVVGVGGGRMRNWNKKTAESRTAPRGIYGCEADGNTSAEKAPGGRMRYWNRRTR